MSNIAKSTSFKTELSRFLIIIHSIWFFMNLIFDLYITYVYKFDLLTYAPVADFLMNYYGYLLFEAIVIAIIVTVFIILRKRMNVIATPNESQLIDTIGFSLIVAYVFSVMFQHNLLISISACFTAFLLNSYYNIKSIRLVSAIGAGITVILALLHDFINYYLNIIEAWVPLVIIIATGIFLKSDKNDFSKQIDHEKSFILKFGSFFIFTAAVLLAIQIVFSGYIFISYKLVYTAEIIMTPLLNLSYANWSWRILSFAVVVILFAIFKNSIIKSTPADKMLFNSTGFILLLTSAVQLLSEKGFSNNPQIVFAVLACVFVTAKYIKSRVSIIILSVYLPLVLLSVFIPMFAWNIYFDYARIIRIFEFIISLLPFVAMIICGAQTRKYSKLITA